MSELSIINKATNISIKDAITRYGTIQFLIKVGNDYDVAYNNLRLYHIVSLDLNPFGDMLFRSEAVVQSYNNKLAVFARLLKLADLSSAIHTIKDTLVSNTVVPMYELSKPFYSSKFKKISGFNSAVIEELAAYDNMCIFAYNKQNIAKADEAKQQHQVYEIMEYLKEAEKASTPEGVIYFMDKAVKILNKMEE